MGARHPYEPGQGQEAKRALTFRAAAGYRAEIFGVERGEQLIGKLTRGFYGPHKHEAQEQVYGLVTAI